MKDPRFIRIEEYDYELPDSKIARFPLEARDESRLLVSRAGEPLHTDVFSNLSSFLPDSSLIVLNNTRVVHARMLFRKPGGSMIEVFCLDPVEPSHDIQVAMGLSSPVVWKCLVGNAKRWKSGALLNEGLSEGQEVRISVSRRGPTLSDGSTEVCFEWEPASLPFSEILSGFGSVPLPPYLHRAPVASDADRYQTVYARPEGSVAAPTAGLHFTNSVFTSLQKRNITTAWLTLHVGAGTFKPVNAELLQGHQMHEEQFIVSKDLVQRLLVHSSRDIVAVGTTSVRTLESLYWLGVRILKGIISESPFHIEQWEPYQESVDNEIPSTKAIEALLEWMDTNGWNEIHGYTSLLIAPPYQFKVVTGLITNFHQPKSTLLLLVSAFAGERWKEAYQFALGQDFRFLSFGDSCLFLR